LRVATLFEVRQKNFVIEGEAVDRAAQKMPFTKSAT